MYGTSNVYPASSIAQFGGARPGCARMLKEMATSTRYSNWWRFEVGAYLVLTARLDASCRGFPALSLGLDKYKYQHTSDESLATRLAPLR